MQYFVYPGHGVGRLIKTETREVLGSKTSFYNIEIIDSGMKILVPVKHAETVGLRPVVSRKQALELQSKLDAPLDTSLRKDTWGRRYREYMELIKSGDLNSLVDVVRAIRSLKIDQELSFGERKMLDSATSMLIRELDIAINN